MSADQDFERAWQAKLAAGVAAVSSNGNAARILTGGEGLSDESPREEVAEWTRAMLERLRDALSEAHVRDVLTGCACQYPAEDLAEIREEYRRTGDLRAAHGLLQDRFRAFLREGLGLGEDAIEDVIRRGWGLAGVLDGDVIVATKIPRSANLERYLAEEDPERRRAAYCHCPRVREILAAGGELPVEYCYCGAGFYKGVWETITERPVEVEVLESVLDGGDLCRIAVRIGAV